jgi:hypothetical protein
VHLVGISMAADGWPHDTPIVLSFGSFQSRSPTAPSSAFEPMASRWGRASGSHWARGRGRR